MYNTFQSNILSDLKSSQEENMFMFEKCTSYQQTKEGKNTSKTYISATRKSQTQLRKKYHTKMKIDIYRKNPMI